MSLIFEDDDVTGLDLSITFGFGVDLLPVPKIAVVPSSELRLMVTIIPDLTPAQAQHSKFRFKADGTEYGIKGFTLDNPVSSTGQKLDLQLTNPAVRSAVKEAEEFVLEHGVVDLISGDTVWSEIFSGSQLSSTSLSIGFGDNAPNDQLSISTLAPLTTKLGKSPARDLIIYDPYRANIEASDQILKDTAGNSYPDELVKVGFLSLHKLIKILMVDKAGFSGFKTNLPDYRIRQCATSKTQTYFQGLAPFLGMFNALTFERDGEIWILDASAVLPDGFPEPRELVVSSYKNLSINEQFENVDGYVLNYSETDPSLASEFDIRTETDTSETGRLFDETYTRTKTVRTFRDYPDSDNPQSSQLWKEDKITSGAFGGEIARTRLERSFDNFGREIKTVKTISNKVPDLPLTGLVMREVRKEIYEVTYQRHPYVKNSVYIAKTVLSVTGLIAIDSENQYLEQDFEQDFVNAHRAGNLKSGMLSRTGAIQKTTQLITPQPDGSVYTETINEDLIRKITTRSSSETKSGDVQLLSNTSRQRQLLVLATDDAVRTGKPVQDLFIADLELNEGIALARRKLKKTSEIGETAANVDKAGVDGSINKGTIMTLKGRDGANYGKVLFEGWKLTATSLGTINQKTSTQVQGAMIK